MPARSLAQARSPATKEAAPQTAPRRPAARPPSANRLRAPPARGAAALRRPRQAAAPPTGSTARTAANAGASATLMSGMSVKDNTGALIGEVKSVKGGLATIQMGADTFTVDSNKLGVQNGAASINATQAELKTMLPPKK